MRKLKEEKNSNFSWHYASKSLENLFPSMMDSFDDLFDSVGESMNHSPIEGDLLNATPNSAEAPTT